MNKTLSTILPFRDYRYRHRCDGRVIWSAAFVGVIVLIPATAIFAQPFVTAVGSGGTILRTDDGGANWNQQPSGLDRELSAVDFVDPQTGWTGGMFQAVDTTRSRTTIRYTLNAGDSWQTADFETIQNPVSVNGLDFIDSDTGWLVGGGGNIWRSDDGGLIWTRQPSGESSDFQAVDFVDRDHGWAVGSTIVHTSNGGDTWETQERPSACCSFLGVAFVDETTGWAVGSQNQLIHTTDGGENWESQPHPNTLSLRDVVFSNPSLGWIVGATGIILRTTNAGNSWDVQPSGTTATLNAVDFVNESEGWIVGESGTILHTIDGGQSWQPQNSGTTATLHDVSVVRPEPLPFLLGDYNRNGTVDAADYVLWRRQLGEVVAPCSGADANCNGFVENSEYGTWKHSFGAMLGGAGGADGNVNSRPAEVPESSSAALFLLATAMLNLITQRAGS